ncbi:hypothetical protein F4780DRAFT_776553 [Xylariomycetidae sp. FL0641]|nr:hypothetical protein F4780DRAFT_776553 [Xylariomycetidae sp. FL0641]
MAVQRAVSALQQAFSDEQVALPGTEAYQKSNNVYLSARQSDYNPAAIFKPKRAEDLKVFLDIVKQDGIQFAIRGAGQQPLEACANIDHGITIDLGLIDGVQLQQGSVSMMGLNQVYYIGNDAASAYGVTDAQTGKLKVPPMLQPFTSVQPQIEQLNSLKTQTLVESATEQAVMASERQRCAYMNCTLRANKEAVIAAADTYTKLTAPLRPIEGVQSILESWVIGTRNGALSDVIFYEPQYMHVAPLRPVKPQHPVRRALVPVKIADIFYMSRIEEMDGPDKHRACKERAKRDAKGADHDCTSTVLSIVVYLITDASMLAKKATDGLKTGVDR